MTDVGHDLRLRETERRLLVLALLVVVGAYGLLELAVHEALSGGFLLFAVALSAVAVVAHAAVRRLASLADPVLLPVVFLLNGLGLVFIRRIDYAQLSTLAGAQTTWTIVGVSAFCLTLLLIPEHRALTRLQYTAGAAAIALLLLPNLPVIGREVNGARLWVQLGPLSFQPGEIAKLAMVVFLAGYLDRKRALLSVATTRVGPFLVPAARHLAPVLAAALAGIAVLVSQRDLGLALLLVGAFVVLLYVATGRLAYPAVGLSVFALGSVLAYLAFPHVQRRFDIWLDPWADVTGAGYQIAQSLFALGTGGLTGTGIGLGHPLIPYAATDAIFAIVGEELGLLGTTALLLSYLLVVAKGYKIALTASDEVGALLAAGLTSLLALQVFVIVGGLTRLVPLTGITLPFVSYGGSSLLSNYVLVALLLRVSDAGRRAAIVGSDRSARGRPLEVGR